MYSADPHRRSRHSFTLTLPRGRSCGFTLPKPRGRASAFTLVELLVVIAIILVLTVLLAPAFTSLKTAGDTTNAAYTDGVSAFAVKYSINAFYP